MQGNLVIGGKKLKSRLFVGTGKFSSADVLRKAVIASESELVTMSVKRVHLHGEKDEILTPLRSLALPFCRTQQGHGTPRRRCTRRRLPANASGQA